MKTILLITVIFGGAYYWYTKNIRIHALKKQRIKNAKPKVKKETVKKNDFRCVVIKADANACSAAAALRNKPILMNEASSLPLAACYKGICDCRFTRHEDRRMSDRRNDSYLSRTGVIDGQHRRESKERRVSAHA